MNEKKANKEYSKELKEVCEMMERLASENKQAFKMLVEELRKMEKENK